MIRSLSLAHGSNVPLDEADDTRLDRCHQRRSLTAQRGRSWPTAVARLTG